MPESDFDRRVGQLTNIILRNLEATRSENEIHILLEESSDTDLEALCRKCGGHMGQAELAEVMKRLRSQTYLAPTS